MQIHKKMRFKRKKLYFTLDIAVKPQYNFVVVGEVIIMKVTLKALRVMQNMTQKEVAQVLGITKDTWSSYERGKTFPDVPMIEKIEALFNVEYNDIIFSDLNAVKPQ